MDFSQDFCMKGDKGGGDKTPKVPRVRRFQVHWTEQYPWVYYDESLGKMFCRTCKEHPDVSDPASAYFTGGCSNFQLMSLASHAKSKGHITAEEVAKLNMATTRDPMSNWTRDDRHVNMAASSAHPIQVVPNEREISIQGSTAGTAGDERMQMRLWRMAAEEAWKNVTPSGYNVPLRFVSPQSQAQSAAQMSQVRTDHNLTMRQPSTNVARVSVPQADKVQSDHFHVRPTSKSPAKCSSVQRLRNLFFNAHALAKKGLPNSDYQWLCDLDRAKGIDIGDSYCLDQCKQFQMGISDTYRLQLKNTIERCQFLSVFWDGVNDFEHQRKTIFVKTVENGKSLVQVLSVEDVDETDPLSLLNALDKAFKAETGDSDWLVKLVGFSSDSPITVRESQDGGCETVTVIENKDCGAVVVKKEPGLDEGNRPGNTNFSLLQELRKHQPDIIGIQCSSHRLHISTKRTFASVDYHIKFENFLTGMQSTWNSCFGNMDNSLIGFSQMDYTLPKYVKNTDWIGQTLTAARVLISGYPDIIDYLNRTQDWGSKQRSFQIKQQKEFMLSQRFVKYIHFLSDMLGVLSNASHVMLETTATIGESFEAISDAVDNLKKLQKRSGQQLAKVEKDTNYHGNVLSEEGNQLFDDDRAAVLASMIENLVACLSDLKEDIMTAMTKLVALSQWPVDSEELKDYADEDLLLIVESYGGLLKKHGVDTDKCLMEWSLLKNHVRRRFSTPCAASWESIFPACKSKCENVLALLTFILTLPGNSVDIEKGYSYVDGLSSEQRNELGAEELKHHLRIFIHTPDIGHFEPNHVIELLGNVTAQEQDGPPMKKARITSGEVENIVWTSEDEMDESVRIHF